MRALLTVIMLSVATAEAPFPHAFPMKHLDEVGHLGTELWDHRKFADLGFAKAFPDDGGLRFEGHDHSGKIWRVWTERIGGSTDVWTADFDHNGEPDLLIASEPADNGHCADRADITILLFDRSGRPAPWMARTQIPHGEQKLPYRPAILLDANKGGAAKLVTTECGPWDANSEDWRVTGVYEAHDTHWLPLLDGNIQPYVQAAHADLSRDNPPGYIHWLPSEPENWVDQMKIAETAPAAPEPAGWPGVVIDGPAGRGIYIQDTDDIARRIFKAGYPVKFLGDKSRPSWLWVDLR